MIIDLRKFVAAEQPVWDELAAVLDRLERDPVWRMSVPELKRFSYLYERTSSDLARVSTFAAQPETRQHLEGLVSRAYGEIHQTRSLPHRIRPLHWVRCVFPQVFRLHIRAFQLSAVLTLAGCVVGGGLLALDPATKPELLPYGHLLEHPSHRVADEEAAVEDRLSGVKARGAAWYVTHNSRVAATTLALGVTWGIGSVLLLFFNGLMLGAVVVDYVLGGEALFLVAWLLPHGALEIPAILVAGQGGLVLAGAMIGWGTRVTLRERLRRIAPDLVVLAAGATGLLLWAGLVEAFLSQYHEPVLPYWLKIGFGLLELGLLIGYLGLSGRAGAQSDPRGMADGEGASLS